MNNITESQLFDYMNCPALYEMKHERGLVMEDEVVLSRLLAKVSKYFYYQLINGKIATMSELKKKWDSICEAHKLTPKQAFAGIDLLNKFALWVSRERPVVLDVDTRYMIKAGETELTGNIGAIVSTSNGQTELLITDFSSKLPEHTLNDMKLKFTLDAYAYEQTFGKQLSGIRIHSVKHDKDFYTFRSRNDYKRAITAVKSIGESIDKKLYYPRESFMCATCPARNVCKYWTREGEQYVN